jgi:hypothetical protein
MRRKNDAEILPLYEDKDGRRRHVALQSSRTLYPSIFLWDVDLIRTLVSCCKYFNIFLGK